MNPLRSIAFFCVLLASLIAVGQEHGGVLYRVPSGWVERSEGDAKIFTPKGLKDSEMLAIILTPATAATSDSKRKQFEAAVAAANGSAKVLTASEVDEKTQGEVSRLVQVQNLESPDLGKHSRMYAMVFDGKQRVLAMMITNRDALIEPNLEAITNFFGSLQFKPSSQSGKIPTGDTPDAYMGSRGFLPSGRGVPIPTADLVNGKPQGLWWRLELDSYSVLHPVAQIYLANGVRAHNPRLGSGSLFDLEGQKRQKGNTGVGSFTIAGGQMVEKYDGFENRGAFASGTDGSGKFFKIGATVFRPLTTATPKAIVGKWTGVGAVRSQYEFLPDGTYRCGQIVDTGDWAAGVTTSGTYTLEGYLLMLRPSSGPIQIDLVGFDRTILMIGTTFHTRKK